MIEVTIPMSRYRRNLVSIIRRNEQIVHKISVNGKWELVHMPKDLYDSHTKELEAESKRRYG